MGGNRPGEAPQTHKGGPPLQDVDWFAEPKAAADDHAPTIFSKEAVRKSLEAARVMRYFSARSAAIQRSSNNTARQRRSEMGSVGGEAGERSQRGRRIRHRHRVEDPKVLHIKETPTLETPSCVANFCIREDRL